MNYIPLVSLFKSNSQNSSLVGYIHFLLDDTLFYKESLNSSFEQVVWNQNEYACTIVHRIEAIMNMCIFTKNAMESQDIEFHLRSSKPNF